MKLVKVTILSGVSTFTRLITGFISVKVVAVVIGPAGVALVGQFSNFITMITAITSCVVNNGLVSYTAKYHSDTLSKHKLWQTSVLLSGWLSLLIGALIMIGSKWLAIIFFYDAKFTSIFLVFGASLILYVWNSLLLSIMNGQHEIAKLTIINSLSSVVGLVLSILLVYYYKVYGVLLALALVPNLMFFISLLMLRNSMWFKLKFFIGKIDRKSCMLLMNFAFMSIIASLVTPLQQLLVRNLMIVNVSMDIAGNWQGLQRISDAYLLIVYTAFNTYFLPKFSSLETKDEIKQELFSCYKIIIPFVAISIIMIYLFRNFIINMLYSKSFGDMGQLFFWQLVGDFFKTIAWPMGLIFVSKGKALVVGFNDLIFNTLIVILSYCLIKFIPIQASVLSFAITYFLWFVWITMLTRKYLND